MIIFSKIKIEISLQKRLKKHMNMSPKNGLALKILEDENKSSLISSLIDKQFFLDAITSKREYRFCEPAARNQPLH